MSGINLKLTEDSWSAGDYSWLLSRKGFDTCRSITLDLSLFSAGHYADGKIPSGTLLGKVTATGKYGPYGSRTEEVQTVTEGGSGLTSFTLTLSGQTTASLDDQATAAQVQTALEALSTVGAGNVIVTGDAGGPYTVRFVGDLANTNVAAMTATPTGGSGTVTIATTTAGAAEVASDGRETCAGHLLHDVRVADASGNAFDYTGAALLWEGIVKISKLPTFDDVTNGVGEYDSSVPTDLPSIRYEA